GPEVLPRLRARGKNAAKPRGGCAVMAAVPVSLATDGAAGPEGFRQTATMYASLPYSRKALDKPFADMSDTPNDRILDELAGIGDERAVKATLERYREAGVTLPIIGHYGGHAGAAKFEE